MKLHHGTAIPSAQLLSGVLPGEAIIHIRQFTLLGMVANLGPSNPLHKMATHSLTN